ncbi:MAG: Cys-Gln thioester bond-forming surface protein [Erysipelotrichaceae bacterium]|nr:Cys-Gln thioester bond-forming surface protein [Erysipelotrichaceae bacterium]
MKKKNIYVPMILLTFAITFIIMQTFDKKSYAAVDNQEIGTIAEGTEFKFVRKNMYSMYHISHTSFRNDVFGTKLLKQKNDDSKKVVVYCAEEGKKLSSGSSRRRYAVNSSNVNLNDTIKDKLAKVMPYMYPYITLGNLKENLKSSTIGIGSDYDSLGFDNLNVQETISAVQAAIWNITDGKTTYNSDGYDKVLSSKLKSAGFRNCDSYYKDKMLTSEEEAWYNEGGCNTNSNFYKYVFSTNTDSNVKNRIKVLTAWYTTNLYEKLTSSANQTDNFSLVSKTFNADNTLNVVIKSTVSNYSIVFYDNNGTELFKNDNVESNTEGDNFTISNVGSNVKQVKAVLTSKVAKKNVYVYIGSGQDFIGVDNSYYSENISIDRNDNGKIIIYKVSDNEEDVKIRTDLTDVDASICGTKGCLENAKFILYYNEIKPENIKAEIKLVNNTVKGTYVLSNLPAGTYYLKETQAPNGYDLYDYGTSLVDSNGYIKLTVDENSTISVIINNKKVPEICFLKVDSKDPNKILDGANLFIEDIDESVYVDFITSSQEGAYCLPEGTLQVGTYYIYEESAPINYIKSNTKYKFVVGKNEKIHEEDSDSEVRGAVELKVINNKITIPNTRGITKSDLSTGACLEGAKLTIKDSNGSVVDEWISSCKKDSQGNVIGNDPHEIPVKPGKYTLTETITPSGYATAETIEFTINEKGEVDKVLDMKDAPIEVCIKKVSKNKENLSGAEFEIYKEDGSLFDKFTTTESDYCTNMPIGKYTIKETAAPKGYQLIEEVKTIEVKDTSETQVFEIENEVIVPRTSLNASKVLTMISLVFIIFGVGAVGYYVYAQKN